MTSDDPQKHNLQVQVNKGTTVTSLKPLAPDTVAKAVVAHDEGASAIKQKLISTIMM